jgi:hemerythrin-like metal-binding protein
MPEWKPELSVGIDRFDDEHRHLISLLNQLHSGMASPNGKSALESVLKELIWYTKSHFRSEELLMKRHGYPELAAHKAEHDRFKEQVRQCADHFQSGRTEIVIELSDALQEWLTYHIIESDGAYTNFFKNLGITGDEEPTFAPKPKPLDCIAGLIPLEF